MIDGDGRDCKDILTEPKSQGEHHTVLSVNWKGHYKRLKLSSSQVLEVPRSACVTKGDSVCVFGSYADVLCQHGHTVRILPSYIKVETIHLGDLEIDVLFKEITHKEEYTAYKSLSDFHYRGQSLFGRTSKLIVRSFHPLFPKVLGYVEITSPLYMNKARATVLNGRFEQNGVGWWDQWDMEAKRKYINVVARVARCVVYPEFRGLGLGKMLLQHAAAFARERWQLGGIRPLFLEISADMLKFVPFAAQAGMVHIGDTEGNLARVYKDMSYLLAKKNQTTEGEIVHESMGIVDKQLSRMEQTLRLVDSEGVTVEELLEKLKGLTEDSALRDFALFHEIISLPKPTYMMGLTPEAEEFLRERVAIVNPHQRKQGLDIGLVSIVSPINLRRLSLAFNSKVRRTQKTHVVQQAFGISPDSIHNQVLNELNVTIVPGEIVLVLGPSGSGKTTLLRFLASQGSISDNVEFSGEFDFPQNYKPGVFELIKSKKPLIELLTVNSFTVENALQLMGIVGLSDAYVYLKRFDELSNGQQYRAMLAYLISQDNNVWLVDEFCASLDSVTANVVADKLQRMARKFHATLIAAAPHCHSFLHSLKPDKVIMLTSAWDYEVIAGEELMATIRAPRMGYMQPQYLRIKAELLEDIRRGRKRATVRKGKQRIQHGLLVFQSGTDHQVVNVTDVKFCHVKNLTEADAVADGFSSRGDLLAKLKEIYPDIRENQFVTVVNFDTMVIGAVST